MWESTLYVLMGTIGYCIIFKVPVRSLAPATFTSSIAWLVRAALIECDFSTVWATFIGAMVIAFFGEIFSRVLKDAVTVYIIPGIVPMVPGAGLYYTMLHFIQGETHLAMESGQETLFTAGAIALGLLVISAVARAVRNVHKNLKGMRQKA